MQLVANSKLVRNRVRLGGGMYIASMAIFLLGLVFTRQEEFSIQTTLVSWASIAIGLLLWTVALGQLRRWGPRQRQETQLADAMSDLDERYKLYAFLSPSLPDYVLVGPAGVQVLVVRNEAGDISCAKDRWKKAGQNRLLGFFDNPFGNPSADAADGIKRVRALLDGEGVADVPVSAVVVFTNDKARLKLEGCTSAVTRVKGLKDVIARAAGKGKNVAVSAARVREIRAVFDSRMERAPAWR